MESSNSSKINIVIWAESESEVRGLAGKVLSTQVSNSDVWSETIEGVQVFGYIRWPACTPSASPAGITDILLVHLSSENSEQWESAKNYVDNRRGIPFKFLTSSSDLSSKASSLGIEFLNVNDVTGGNAKEKLIKSSLSLEQTLRAAFHTIDTDKDGFIDESEILNASKNLNHPLNDEDAKEIAKSLSTNGKISFEKFKQWWVMGRTDFNSFRRIIGIEMKVNNLIKKSSETFNSYLEKFAQEGNDTQQGGFNSRVNVVPHEDFHSGTAVNLHFTLGNDFNSIADSLPSYLKETPASFGLELKLKNAESGPIVLEVLSGVKELVGQMVPNVEQFYSAGVGVNFRQVGTSIFIDISYGGMLGDKISGLLSMFNLSSLNFSGGSDIHLCSKLSPVEVLEMKLAEIIDTFSNIKLEGKGDYTHLKTVFSFAINTLTALNHGNLPSKLKPLAYFLKVASVVRKLEFKFTYDSSVISEIIKDSINNAGGYYEPVEGKHSTRFEQKEQEWIDDIQARMKENVNQMGGMAAMFLEPYKPAILALDLDNISVYATCPILKAYVKLLLTINKGSEFVANILG